MKRVVVTGASGFIGRHCLPQLIEKGYEVHAVADKILDLEGVQWYQLDLLRESAIQSIMEQVRPSHLLHFAWCATPGTYWTSPENLDWVKASINLIQAFKKKDGERVVMAGTCAEYDWQFGYCSEKITPLSPKSLYGICKNSLHEVLDSYSALESLSAAWGRIFYLYGPHENPARLVASVINDILDGRLVRSTHGDQIRDFLHVEDIASAFVNLLDCEVNGAVNIASGVPVTIKTVISEIANITGRFDLLNFGSIHVSEDDPPFLVADTTRLKHEVKWSSSISLKDGLQKTVDWWRKMRCG